MSRDKKVYLSHCPFVPGQKTFSCPTVPLSQNKSSSENPETNSSVPGYSGMGQAVKIPSWPVPWQNVKILSQPVLWQDFELVPLSLCPGTMKRLLSLCPAGQENPVLLETLIQDSQSESLRAQKSTSVLR